MTRSQESTRSGAPISARRLPLWPPLFVLAAFLSYLFTPVLPNAVLSADAQNFQDRMSAILDGNMPYVDTLYEHLPLALPPMLLPRILPGGAETFIYTALFGAFMTAFLIGTGVVVGRLGAAAGRDGAATGWAAVALPLVPIVAFRIDPVPTLLAAVALYLAFTARPGPAGWASVAAIAAKGWPVVLAPVEWWAGRRRRAVGLAAFTAVLGAVLLLTPGFQEGRDFSGVHLETMAGSLLAWIRSLGGADSGLGMSAGAVYVAAPGAVLVVGITLGSGLLWLTRRLWRQPVSLSSAAQLVGLLTMAMLLASPLLSAQFLLWLTPWIIFFPGSRIRRLFIAAGLATTGLLALWDPNEVVWQSVLLARNVLLLGVAWEMVRHARSHSESPPGMVRSQA